MLQVLPYLRDHVEDLWHFSVFWVLHHFGRAAMVLFFSLVVEQVDFLQVFNDISTSSTNNKFELDLVYICST